jgi:transposase InsO family protein
VNTGSPFIAMNARGGLTRLSAWWIALGIRLVRSRVGCPQDNGAHERMHRDMAGELEAFPAKTKSAVFTTSPSRGPKTNSI